MHSAFMETDEFLIFALELELLYLEGLVLFESSHNPYFASSFQSGKGDSSNISLPSWILISCVVKLCVLPRSKASKHDFSWLEACKLFFNSFTKMTSESLEESSWPSKIDPNSSDASSIFFSSLHLLVHTLVGIKFCHLFLISCLIIWVKREYVLKHGYLTIPFITYRLGNLPDFLNTVCVSLISQVHNLRFLLFYNILLNNILYE